MNYKYKNMLIDGLYPLCFWGTVYLLLPISHYWTWEMFISWYLAMVLFSPLNVASGRVLNTWRKKLGYNYKNYGG